MYVCIYVCIHLFIFTLQGIKPRGLCKLGKHSTNELNLQPVSVITLIDHGFFLAALYY
jgi:hypothetical protein